MPYAYVKILNQKKINVIKWVWDFSFRKDDPATNIIPISPKIIIFLYYSNWSGLWTQTCFFDNRLNAFQSAFIVNVIHFARIITWNSLETFCVSIHLVIISLLLWLLWYHSVVSTICFDWEFELWKCFEKSLWFLLQIYDCRVWQRDKCLTTNQLILCIMYFNL